MRTFLFVVLAVGAIVAETTPSDAQLAPALPAVDARCSVDTDCAATMLDTTGPNTCCSGCGTSTAGNKAWVRSFEASCPAWLSAMGRTCPARACVGGRLTTACDAGRCVIR